MVVALRQEGHYSTSRWATRSNRITLREHEMCFFLYGICYFVRESIGLMADPTFALCCLSWPRLIRLTDSVLWTNQAMATQTRIGTCGANPAIWMPAVSIFYDCVHHSVRWTNNPWKFNRMYIRSCVVGFFFHCSQYHLGIVGATMSFMGARETRVVEAGWKDRYISPLVKPGGWLW